MNNTQRLKDEIADLWGVLSLLELLSKVNINEDGDFQCGLGIIAKALEKATVNIQEIADGMNE